MLTEIQPIEEPPYQWFRPGRLEEPCLVVSLTGWDPCRHPKGHGGPHSWEGPLQTRRDA